MKTILRLLVVAMCVVIASPAMAQWTNRYPRVASYGHHVYLEGYELPMLTNGPIDPTVSPDGSQIAFASRGWIWVMDRETGIARRLTMGAGIDARPAFSPDGGTVGFVRDQDNDTTIVLLNLGTGAETTLVDTGAIDMDPVFTPDGSTVIHVSAQGGDLDVWAVAVDGGESSRLTDEAGLEVAARPTADGAIVYLAKTRGGVDELRWRRGDTESVVASWRIASVARPALNVAGTAVAVNAPLGDATHLQVIELARPSAPMRLAPNAINPLTPTWTPDGREVLYSEADGRQQMRLYAAPLSGAPAEEIVVRDWDWGAPTATLRVRTRQVGRIGFTPSRLSLWTGDGHPIVLDSGITYLDGSVGWPFAYSDGDVEVTVPAGSVRVVAARGLSVVPVQQTVELVAGETVVIELELESVWPAETGWASGDHHFHLNYGGIYQLPPAVMEGMAAGEALDVPTPLTANLHNRFEDAELWSWESNSRVPMVRFGQEIRSHFLGHIGTIGNQEMLWPWIWGPGYEVYGNEDRINGEMLEAARDDGAVGFYVHPVTNSDPFGGETVRGVPPGIVADAVHGQLDALEVVCLWSDEIGTAELWYRFLNAGIPVAPSAGTDVMLNLVRTMAFGTTRVYVQQPDGLTWNGYLDGLRAGRSFVTNGPLLDLRVTGGNVVARPGDVVSGESVTFELDVATASEVEVVELIVNGEVVETWDGLVEPGSRLITGTVDLPSGGWVAARARGGEVAWPAMDSYPWAHTAPIWIGSVGSTEPTSRAAAAADLLRALDVSTERLRLGYQGAEIPRLEAHFAAARRRLEQMR
ncbi:MAG: hypothetical protein GKS06_12390 [Acidobacteria bacterium]|nr:hypothetical protein [Acidobacteriota bacterium]